MVIRGPAPATPTTRRLAACARVAEDDADRLWAVVVAILGQTVAEASTAGRAHLAALDHRGRP